MNDEPADEFDHEQTLQQVLLHLLQVEATDLEELCEAAGIPTLTDTAGQPVYLTSVRSYEDAGIMTLDKGVWIELSDGSQFGYTITVGRRPTSYTPLITPPPSRGSHRVLTAVTATSGGAAFRMPTRRPRHRPQQHPVGAGGPHLSTWSLL